MEEHQVAAIVHCAIVGDFAVRHGALVLLEGCAHADTKVVGLRPPERIPVQNALERATVQAIEVEALVEIDGHHLRILPSLQAHFVVGYVWIEWRTLMLGIVLRLKILQETYGT